MNSPSDPVPESAIGARATALDRTFATRPMYWSVRRELWENRSIYIAPLVVVAVLLVGFSISAIGMPQRRHAVLALNPVQQRAAMELPYSIAASMLILTAFIVGFFYCLDALHGERRDRSILFWKSLPVSDLTTVLSKAGIPLVVLPLLTFGFIAGTQMFMRLVSTAALAEDGPGAAATWVRLPILPMSLAQLYTLTAIALWHAPVYGWLLLVSAWARRATFLWAVLPFLAISLLEKITFSTSHFASLLRYRLVGWSAEAFEGIVPKVPFSTATQPTPGDFLTTPGLWIGLLLAATFLAAAVRLRRYREPI
jgi:ABC-2 type transport system permease protein